MNNETIQIAFFSRGRGRGHAIPDLSIAEKLQSFNLQVEIVWISYGTGAAAIRERGYDVIDLDLPDDNLFLETHLRAVGVLDRVRPDLVISHEEFSVPPAANRLGIPNVFITDFFWDADQLWMRSLQYANEIIFIDEPGFFVVPDYLIEKTYYAGTFVRSFKCSRKDRELVRSQLGLCPETKFVLAFSGYWFTEERAPIFDLLIPAFCSLAFEKKCLIWMAGNDCESLTKRLAGEPNITVKTFDPDIDRLMIACDLAVTKGTRSTSLELAHLGVPSLSLTHGLNPVDDLRTSYISSNTQLRVCDIDSTALSGHIIRRLESAHTPDLSSGHASLAACALRIGQHVRRIRDARQLTP